MRLLLILAYDKCVKFDPKKAYEAQYRNAAQTRMKSECKRMPVLQSRNLIVDCVLDNDQR